MNHDYTFFVESGFLYMLVVASAGLARLEPGWRWPWLALHAGALTLRAWTRIVEVDLGGSLFLDTAQLTLLTIAVIALVEFAGGFPRPFDRPRRRWLAYGGGAILGLIAAATAGWLGLTGFVAALGIVAGVQIFRRLRLQRAEETNLRCATRLGAIAWLAPVHAASLAADAFCQRPGLASEVMDVHLAAAVVATLFCLAVYAHNAARQRQRLPPVSARAWMRRRWICTAGVWSVVIAGWLAADAVAKREDASLRDEVLLRTRLAAAAIDPALVAELQWNESDLSRPSYARLKEVMRLQRETSPDMRFALLTGLQAGRAVFLVDSEPPESPDYSPPGQVYEEAAPDYLAGLVSRRAFVSGPVVDRWGTWVAASAPLASAADARPVNFEINISAAAWAAHIRETRFPVVLIAWLICLLILGFFQMQERQRESSLRIAQSEQRNSSLVEGSPDCVQMFDAAGRYLSINRNGLLALGHTRAMLIGRPFVEVWPEAVRPAIADAVRRTAAGEPIQLEADYVRPDGRRLTWRVATNPIRDENNVVSSFVGICVDLTGRKQAEAALRAAKEAAEAATRTKSEFLAVMSHELRTPLAGVIGMLDLLRRPRPEPLRQQYVEVARDCADTLLHLLDDILDTAKIEAGKLSLESIPFHPRRELRHLFEAARLRAENKGLEFAWSVDPQVPEVLVGDPTRLRQVLGNLQNNALKFTERGGVYVTLSAIPRGDGSVDLSLSVRDTGVGISEENRARLFAKFEQGDLSTTRRYGGTGLGLSIVKALADALGGSVNVHSEPGAGSTFTFSAPFTVGTAAEENTARTSSPAPSAPAYRLRVLCAEDDPVNRMVAEDLVTRGGHEFVWADNGQIALELLQQHQFDLVLMDNRMPVIDGLKATQELRRGRAGERNREVYICAATANVSETDRRLCREAGMDDFIAKPLAEAELAAVFRRAIEHLLSRNVALRPAEPVARPGNAVAGLSESELLAALDEPSPSVERAACDFPPETLATLRDLFWQDAPARFAELRNALARRDRQTLGNISHALKSSAHYIGAPQLARSAAELERLAESDDFDAIAEALLAVEAALQSFEAEHPSSAASR